ncbi:MAG: VIT domain-containing protein [Planctomycetota bacterium]
MRLVAPRFAIAAGLAIALGLTAPACGRKSSAPPPAPQAAAAISDQPTSGPIEVAGDDPFFAAGAEVVVISPDGTVIPPAATAPGVYQPAASMQGFDDDPRFVLDAGDDHNEDPTNDPYNQDLRPNPSPDQSNAESPYPNQGFNSSIGLGSNIGGGGGPGGAGGFVYRRARGGGGHRGDQNVLLALRWLADHQAADGSWDPIDFPKAGANHGRTAGEYGNQDGSFDIGLGHERVATTGLALLAFLGAGYTHTEGEFATPVKLALRYLKAVQDNDGAFDTTNRHDPLFVYGHAIGTMAMAEAYGMTGANMLKGPAQKGVDFIASCQNHDDARGYLGWGDGIKVLPSNTIITGWNALALKSARIADLDVPQHCWDGAITHLSDVTGKVDGDAKTWNTKKHETSVARGETTDAMSIMVRMFVSQDAALRNDPTMRDLAKRLTRPDVLPVIGDAPTRDLQFLLFTTLALFQMGDTWWKTWETPIGDALINTQRIKPADVHHRAYGSWDSSSTGAAFANGRVYATAINALTLETYYRYEKVGTRVPATQDRDGLQDSDEGDGTWDNPRTPRAPRYTDRWTKDAYGRDCWNGRPVTQGQMYWRGGTGVLGVFPLTHTAVNAAVSGMISSVEVRQSYRNELTEAMEAIYAFPLPENAAVNEFILIIGERKIHGFIRERREAQRIYNHARANGHTAALLTQERPSVFTQHVANIPAGGTLDVSIRYFAPLKYDNGEYTFVFPMVVAPRYTPSNNQGMAPTPTPDLEPNSGYGTSYPTSAVPDADHVTPPTMWAGTRSGRDIAIRLTIDAGVPIEKIESVNHAIMAQRVSPKEMRIQLHPADTLPNKDFVLRYRVAGALPAYGMVAHHNEKQGGFFALMVQPPHTPTPEQIVPRELVFVVDNSGSMNGKPMDQCQALMWKALGGLRKGDTFNIITFAGSSQTLFRESVEPTDMNVQLAWNYVSRLTGAGGTEFLSSLRQLSTMPRDRGRMRVVTFLTDGLVNNDDAIIDSVQAAQRCDARTRYFAVGVGSSPNRALIERIASNGLGRSLFIGVNESANAPAETFFRYIDAPVLWDFSLDWGNLQVEQLYPSQLGDLWAGQPLILYGRYTTAGIGELTIKARRGYGEMVEIKVPVSLPGGNVGNPALASVWARHRIEELSDACLSCSQYDRSTMQGEIKQIALDFHLLSKFTAFVAVDYSARVSNGNPVTVQQPQEHADGMTNTGDVAPAAVMAGPRLAAWGVELMVLPDGTVWIDRVIPGSDAALAGLRAGVRVLGCDGVRIASADDLRRVVGDGVMVETADGGTVDRYYLPR